MIRQIYRWSFQQLQLSHYESLSKGIVHRYAMETKLEYIKKNGGEFRKSWRTPIAIRRALSVLEKSLHRIKCNFNLGDLEYVILNDPSVRCRMRKFNDGYAVLIPIGCLYRAYNFTKIFKSDISTYQSISSPDAEWAGDAPSFINEKYKNKPFHPLLKRPLLSFLLVI